MKDGAIIRCERVTVAYGEEVVLREVSLEVHRGEFVPLIGPNGAGKTTLLRAILGLIKPRSGRIESSFGGQPPGYVSQMKAIDPLFPVSVREIVQMGLYPQLGWRRSPGRAEWMRLEEALERFGLRAHARKTFAELSGGMKQKALLARAFVSGAEVLVMDEPTAELDEDSEREVLGHLHELSRTLGKTVLLAHHGLEDVAPLADRLCLVDHGRVQTCAPPALIDERRDGRPW